MAAGHLITSFVSLVTVSVVVRILAFAGPVLVIRAVGPCDFGTFAFGLTRMTSISAAIAIGC